MGGPIQEETGPRSARSRPPRIEEGIPNPAPRCARVRTTLVSLACLALVAVPLAIAVNDVVARTLAGYAVAAVIFRAVDVARAPGTFRSLPRAAVLLIVLDPRRARRVPRQLQAGRLVMSAVLGAISVGLLAGAHALLEGEAPFGSARQYARAWVGGFALLAGAESSAALLSAGAAAAGWDVPSLHRSPARSRTLSEFWGQRWNRLVGSWLRAHAFEPLARAGLPRAGIVAAFGASAIVHAYPTALAVGLGPAATIGAFFVAHGALIVVEAQVGVRRWPRAARHAFLVAAFAATLPLFVEPFLRSLSL